MCLGAMGSCVGGAMGCAPPWCTGMLNRWTGETEDTCEDGTLPITSLLEVPLFTADSFSEAAVSVVL